MLNTVDSINKVELAFFISINDKIRQFPTVREWYYQEKSFQNIENIDLSYEIITRMHDMIKEYQYV